MDSPESFIFILRLNSDSTKSPYVPAITVSKPIVIHFHNGNISTYMEIKNAIANVNIAPPTKPSQDFLGEILLKRLVLPKSVPAK